MDIIDRKQLLSIFHNKAFAKANTDIPYKELLWAIKVIEQAPSAEKTGKWIDRGSLSCRCSECGCKSPKEYTYCPNCGALMKGE